MDQKPPQAEMLAPDMVSHINLREKGWESKQCTKNIKKLHFYHVDQDNKTAASDFDASNYLYVSCGAKHQSVNIHSCLFTQRMGLLGQTLWVSTGCPNRENKGCNQSIEPDWWLVGVVVWLKHAFEASKRSLYKICLKSQIRH